MGRGPLHVSFPVASPALLKMLMPAPGLTMPMTSTFESSSPGQILTLQAPKSSSTRNKKTLSCFVYPKRSVRGHSWHAPDLWVLNFTSVLDLATPAQTHNLYLTLLTLLFAYAYEARTTQRDPTPESAWTIASLTPAFSALDPPPYGHPPSSDPSTFTEAELADTLTASYRRSLAFPLYRSFALAEACRADVAALLARGKRVVARCLMEMKDILDYHDVYYVYSKIWVDDFCTWTLANAR